MHITPSIGKIASADVGDPMIKAQSFKHIRTLYTDEPIRYDKGGKIKSIEVTPKYLLKGVYSKGGGVFYDRYCSLSLCICIDTLTHEIKEIHNISSLTGVGNIRSYPVVSDKPIYLLEKEVTQIPIPDGIKRHLIYNGKVGGMIKFTYREFYADIARPAFTQDIQYDLSESNIIGFKGAQFEIINASNVKIDYKILSSFK